MANEHIEKLRELVECTKSDEAFARSRYTDEGSREDATWLIVLHMGKRVMYAVKETEDEQSLVEVIDLVKEYMGKGYEKKFEEQVYRAVRMLEREYGNTAYHYLLDLKCDKNK